jgi:hypothetical protein
MDIKYILKIFIIGFLIVSLILFINSIGLTFKETPIEKELIKVITVEGLTRNDNNNNTFLSDNATNAFCKINTGFDLEKSCNELTKYNCGLTSCCVWTNNKCKAGDKNGPLFNTNKNGKTMELSGYYFKNKCYGTTC